LPSRRRWSALKRDQDDFYDTTGSSFFIIKQGTATCIQADPHGNQQEVAQLTTGDYFGEIALLASKPRQGTVKATEKNGTLKYVPHARATPACQDS
jgi:CRP-like cAMP-binding protein